MITIIDYCDYETSLGLRDLGYNGFDNKVYCDWAVVKDSIIDKYGNLTDDGYYELTKECGGELEFEEVYDTSVKLYDRPSRNSWKEAICTAPLLYSAQKWLCGNHNISVSVKPYPCEDGLRWLCEIRSFQVDKVCLDRTITGYTSPESALSAGINEVVKSLNPNCHETIYQ